MDKQQTRKSADTIIAKILSDETPQKEFDSLGEQIMNQEAIRDPEHDLELLRSLIARRSQERLAN